MTDPTARLPALLAEYASRQDARARGGVIDQDLIPRGGFDLDPDAPANLGDARLAEEITFCEKAIYGTDDRKELFELTVPQKRRCASVAAVVRRRDLELDGGRYHLASSHFGTRYRLCPGQAFFDQPSAPFGTAWVIDGHHLVTAGHCITRELKGQWADAAFVFGFAMTSATDATTVFAAEQVYFAAAAAVMHDEAGEDWAVLRTDRPLTAAPLALRDGPVGLGEAMTVIGHPCGLPVKYAGSAMVTRRKSDHRFLATLDTFGGNSGSPVFDEANQVAGMLVRGAPDWLSKGGCNMARGYPDTGQDGEEVLDVRYVRDRRPGPQPDESR